MTQMEPALSRLAQIALTVHDIGQATTFYRDTLGLPLLFEAPPKLVFFDCAGVRLMLSEPEGDGEEATIEASGAGSILYFDVEDIERSHRALSERGLAFDKAPETVHRDAGHELRLASFRDPSGNLLALMSRVPVAGA